MGKAFEKQIKTIEDQGKKQVDALNTLKSNNQLTIEDVIPNDALNNNEAKKELDKIKEIEKSVDREKLTHETNEYTFSFEDFQAIKTFGRDIYEGKITIKEADEYQKDLLVEIMNFRKTKKKKKSKKKNKEEKVFLKTFIIFGREEKKLLTLLKAKYFSQNLRVLAF